MSSLSKTFQREEEPSFSDTRCSITLPNTPQEKKQSSQVFLAVFEKLAGLFHVNNVLFYVFSACQFTACTVLMLALSKWIFFFFFNCANCAIADCAN